jgi:hypothetical protein
LAAQDHVRWYDLMRIILSWAMWRRPGPERPALVAAAQTVQADVNRHKEIGLMAQTIAESIFEEGQLKGELNTARRVLRQMLIKRFGTVSEQLLQRIENSTDVERLVAATLEVSSLTAPEDLRI